MLHFHIVQQFTGRSQIKRLSKQVCHACILFFTPAACEDRQLGVFPCFANDIHDCRVHNNVGHSSEADLEVVHRMPAHSIRKPVSKWCCAICITI